MPLSDTKIRARKPRDRKYIEADEKGLAVEVTSTGLYRHKALGIPLPPPIIHSRNHHAAPPENQSKPLS